MAETIIVIPCYDEATRLPVDEFLGFLSGALSGTPGPVAVDGHQGDPHTGFIFVNDGSRDGTLALLCDLERRHPDRVSVIDQPDNRGKAEAVRVGMKAGFAHGAERVGYFDADLSTPLSEISRLAAVLDERPVVEIVFGARVQLLGRTIRRRTRRHYLGRVFATVASLALRLAVYDTQCGAKLFRNSETCRALFAEPFRTRWIFDVEIVARLIALQGRHALAPTEELIYELPLDQWIDIGGSKLEPFDFVRSFFEMGVIYWRYLRRGPHSREDE